MLASIPTGEDDDAPMEDVVGFLALTNLAQQQRRPCDERERLDLNRDSNQRIKRPNMDVDRITTGRDWNSSIDGVLISKRNGEDETSPSSTNTVPISTPSASGMISSP